MWQCLHTILNIPEESTALIRAITSLPLLLGGLGLRSTRTSFSAWWASWADTLPMFHARHPDVATMILHGLNHEAQEPNVRGVVDAVRMLTGVEGFEPPSWEALLDGARPPPRDPEDHEPGGTRGGWQHEAASRVERNFRDRRLMLVMSRSDQALLRSQSGPFGGMALSAAPTNAHCPGSARSCSVSCCFGDSVSPSLFTCMSMWPFA